MESGFHPPIRALKLVEPPPEAPAPARSRCLDCDEELAGKFCHGCGQAAKTKRFTFHDFLHEIPHALIHLDHALVHTLKALLRRPGPAIREYLEGKRTKVYSPVSLFFMLAGVVALVKIASEPAFVADPENILTLGRHKIDIVKTVEIGARFMREKRAFFQVLAVPFNAVLPWLILRRRTKLGFAEQTMAATMIATGMAAIGIVFLPALWALRERTKLQGIVGSVQGVVVFAYSVWAYAGLQADTAGESASEKRSRYWRGLLATLGFVCGGSVIMLAITLALVVSLLATGLGYAALGGLLRD